MKTHPFVLKRFFLTISLSVLAFLGAQVSHAAEPVLLVKPADLKIPPSLTQTLKTGTPLSAKQMVELQQRIDALTSKQLSVMGTKDGGGGDTMAFEFQGLAKEALGHLQQVSPETYAELVKRDLATTIENAKIIFVDAALNVEINDLIQSSIAFNSPKTQTILVNRQKWNGLFNNYLRQTIALHEFLSLIGVESTGSYPVSSKLWSYLSVKNPSRQKDEGSIPSVTYVCATSTNNMTGIGVRYQISLAENLSQVIYSQTTVGNVAKEWIAEEIARTRKSSPATVKNLGSEYYLDSRLYNAEDANSYVENAILDTKNNLLKIVMIDGRLLPIPCKLVSKF